MTMRLTMNAIIRARRHLPVALCALVTACTDPTSVGAAPSFVTLERVSDLRLAVDVVGADPGTCPPIEPVEPSWTRQQVTGSTATIALSPRLRESSGFTPRPGRVFVDRWLGLVAVTFDNDIARFEPAPLFGAIDRAQEIRPDVFRSRCTTTIDGRPAVILMQVTAVQRPDGSIDFRRLEPALPVAIVRTGPDGRRATVMVAAIDGASRPLSTDPDGRALLAMAASLRW